MGGFTSSHPVLYRHGSILLQDSSGADKDTHQNPIRRSGLKWLDNGMTRNEWPRRWPVSTFLFSPLRNKGMKKKKEVKKKLKKVSDMKCTTAISLAKMKDLGIAAVHPKKNWELCPFPFPEIPKNSGEFNRGNHLSGRLLLRFFSNIGLRYITGWSNFCRNSLLLFFNKRLIPVQLYYLVIYNMVYMSLIKFPIHFNNIDRLKSSITNSKWWQLSPKTMVVHS